MRRRATGAQGADNTATLLPLTAIFLLLPPFILVFAVPVLVAGVPLIVAYVFSVWAAIILGAGLVARRLGQPPRAPEEQPGQGPR